MFSKLPDDTDFEDITSDGIYTVYTGTNSPSGTKAYFCVIVLTFNGDKNYVTQIITYMGNLNLYIRRRNNGNWGAFHKLTPTEV